MSSTSGGLSVGPLVNDLQTAIEDQVELHSHPEEVIIETFLL